MKGSNGKKINHFVTVSVFGIAIFLLTSPYYFAFTQEKASAFSTSVARVRLAPNENRSDETKARELVRASINAMGGESKLRAIANVTVDGIGHEYAVEQSERPEGPFLVTYQQITEVRDILNNKLRRTTQMRQVQVPQWLSINTIIAEGTAIYERGGQFMPRSPSEVLEGEMLLNLSPERLFLNALDAKDLRTNGTTVLESVSQNIIRFTWRNVPVTVFLNAFTNLPTAVETLNTSPDNVFWSVWGDYLTRTVYSNWTLEPGGLHYPRQRDITRNGYPLQSFTITEIRFNSSIEPEKFQISEDAKKQARSALFDTEKIPLGSQRDPAVEFAKDILYIPGRWGVSLVRQADGIVIIEAPISSGYSAKVIAEVKRRYPDERIKAVITSSDAFPHIGGIREYAANGIPIYALDLNVPLLERIMSAQRRTFPDALESRPRKVNFKIVSNKVVLGAGSTRMEIYPVRSETGERMLMVYFPEHRLLYASDLIQKLPNGDFFAPQYLTEIKSAVERENLNVEMVFAMHLKAIPWGEVAQSVAKVIQERADTTETAAKLIKQIRDADYRADQTALQRLYDELEPLASDSGIRASIRYWRGFAQWRRAINGFNDSVDIKTLEQSLKLAIIEFEKALEINPAFVDAIAGVSSATGILLFLYAKNPGLDKNPAKSREMFTATLQRLNDAEKLYGNHPRLLWVLAQVRWSMPAQMGGGQDKSIELSKRGLNLVRDMKTPPSDILAPTWGEPELLMNLAFYSLNKTNPDLDAAESYARSALALVPHWHYVKDILLPQIAKARAQKP